MFGVASRLRRLRTFGVIRHLGNDIVAEILRGEGDEPMGTPADLERLKIHYYGYKRAIDPSLLDRAGSPVHQSPTAKIEPDGIQFVFPDADLKRVSDCLSLVFEGVWRGKLAISDVVRYDESNEAVEFYLPGLEGACDERKSAYWRPVRPVYFPV